MSEFKINTNNKASVEGSILEALKMLAGKAGGALGRGFGSLVPSAQFSYDFRSPVPAQAQQEPSSSPVAMAQQLIQPAPSATPIAIPEDRLRQNITNTWGADTPLLQAMQLYMQAGNELPGNMEKLLPIALALRETQGGKDLVNPKKNSKLGKNNVANLKNDMGAFQNYPDLETAVRGNISQGGESSGIVGLLRGDEASNKSIYEDFRQTNDYRDLFKKWSPPSDSNGSLDEQTQNLEWILNKLKNG